MKLAKKLTTLFVLCLLAVSVFIPIKYNQVEAYAAGCSGKAMCVIEKDNGRVLFSKNKDEKLPMASTTKVMTAITALENCNNLQELIEVADVSIGVEGTSIYLRKGEQIKIEDLLYGLMLRSGNDAATALACHIGGSVEGFAKKMNELASKIGANNSHFANPHGLDNPDHYTTAHDLAKIAAYALNNSTFKEIVSTKSHVIEATNKSEKRYLTNKNKLLSTLEGCCGVKTGFTSKAGRCLVSACERENMTIVCVVLNDGPMFEDSAALLNESFDSFENVKIVDKNKEIYNEYIIDETAGKLYLYAEDDFYYPLKEDEKDNIQIKYTLHMNNAKENECVGEIKVFLDNQLLKTLKLFTMNKIDKLIDSNTLQIAELIWSE